MSTEENRLVERIRSGDADAWQDFINQYEGRLLAYVQRRINRVQDAEDIVQETFIGFLNSLPNFDPEKRLENYLFSIAAHKLTDSLRKMGRRPTVPLSSNGNSSASWEPEGNQRAASSMMRSGERKVREEEILKDFLKNLFDQWKSQGAYEKLSCLELLFLRGWSNKEVAEQLEITEQKVANYKFDFIAKLKKNIDVEQTESVLLPAE